MRSSLLAFGLATFVQVLPPLPANAANVSDFAGTWSDNVGGNAKLGRLVVMPGVIKVNRDDYPVGPGMPFADGTLFKVRGDPGKARDRLGCGPSGRVGYIVLQPLPRLEGTDRTSIQALFYGGSTPPDAAKLSDDPLVCSTHPFGRGG